MPLETAPREVASAGNNKDKEEEEEETERGEPAVKKAVKEMETQSKQVKKARRTKVNHARSKGVVARSQR